jgi:transposase
MRNYLEGKLVGEVMGRSRRKEIKHHLPEEEIDKMFREAEDDARLRRIGFVKNLYQGDTVPEAAEREGRSPATGNRWADAWNEGGFEELIPSFGGGRPPKLDEDEQAELLELLQDGQPWKSQEIQHLLAEEFDVAYHPDYLGKFLRDLGLSYAKPRPKRPNRPENPAEILDEPHNKREGDDDER